VTQATRIGCPEKNLPAQHCGMFTKAHWPVDVRHRRVLGRVCHRIRGHGPYDVREHELPREAEDRARPRKGRRRGVRHRERLLRIALPALWQHPRKCGHKRHQQDGDHSPAFASQCLHHGEVTPDFRRASLSDCGLGSYAGSPKVKKRQSPAKAEPWTCPPCAAVSFPPEAAGRFFTWRVRHLPCARPGTLCGFKGGAKV
jgi:hypothetical protein